MLSQYGSTCLMLSQYGCECLFYFETERLFLSSKIMLTTAVHLLSTHKYNNFLPFLNSYVWVVVPLLTVQYDWIL